MATHDLKIWPIYFAAVVDGRKRFEIRENDREFMVGDTLRLREYNPAHGGSYTGREITVEVTYLTTMHQVDRYVVMGIAPTKPVEAEGGQAAFVQTVPGSFRPFCCRFAEGACTCFDSEGHRIATPSQPEQSEKEKP